MKTIDIIIPTWNNERQLIDCVNSILTLNLLYPVQVIIVNNGSDQLKQEKYLMENKQILFLQTEHNLGWEGGLKLGLEHSKSEFVVFMNDDTFVPEFSRYWIRDLLQPFRDPLVGAVGPASNVVMGKQNIFMNNEGFWSGYYSVSFLVGFCIMLRREALDKVGGVDDTLIDGGDDIDLSIRLKDKGYRLVANNNVFIWHFGFQTGVKIHGGPERAGGWNSIEKTTKTNIGLIRKHGLKRWFNCLYGQPEKYAADSEDKEGNFVEKQCPCLRERCCKVYV